MKIIKILLFICVILIVVAIANLLNKSKTNYEKNIKTPFTASTIIVYGNDGIKTLASLSLKNSWDTLSGIFEVDAKDIRGKVLQKKIDVIDMEGNVSVFVGDNTIEQITVSLQSPKEEGSIDRFINKIISDMENKNMALDKEIIDGPEGEDLADIITYKTEDMKLVITKSTLDNRKYASIDLINLKIL